MICFFGHARYTLLKGVIFLFNIQKKDEISLVTTQKLEKDFNLRNETNAEIAFQ